MVLGLSPCLSLPGWHQGMALRASGAGSDSERDSSPSRQLTPTETSRTTGTPGERRGTTHPLTAQVGPVTLTAQVLVVVVSPCTPAARRPRQSWGAVVAVAVAADRAGSAMQAATRLVLTVGALAAGAHGSGCGRNNGGCVPGTRCSVGAGGRIDCDYSHTCPTLPMPANGFVSCPGAAPGAQPTYSLRLVEGNLARSVEQRTECLVGCNAGFSAIGFTSPRYCTATGWSDTTAVRCIASPQCSATNNPCQHGGRCTATVNGGYRCRCTTGWAGRTCQEADSVRPLLPNLPLLCPTTTAVTAS